MNEIILDLTTMKLQIQMGEAKTTTEMDIDVSYVNDTVGTSRTGASQQSTTNGVTLADILSAPASGHVLVVKQILVTNRDTVVHTFKVWRVVSGDSNFEVFGQPVSVAVGATWDSNASGGSGGGATYSGTAPIAVSGSAISLAPDTATAKTTLVGADEILSGDSAAGFAPKKTTFTQLWANTVGVLIAALTAKTTPVGADTIEVADSAASNATKAVTLTNLFAQLGVFINAFTAKTTPVDADVTNIGDSAASFASKAVTLLNLWTNYLKAKTDALYTTLNGWTAGLGTWTYSSADAPTFVIATSVDNTGVIGVGDRIQLTQTTVKYFIVTAITSSTITVYGGTNYTLVSAAITSPNYSHVKSPLGFPMDATLWQVVIEDTASDRTQNTPTQNTWYNLNTNLINVPIGSWNLGYSVIISSTSAAAQTQTNVWSTLSTTNNSASDAYFNAAAASLGASSTLTTIGAMYRSKKITVAAKTPYYFNIRTNLTNQASITEYNNAIAPLHLVAECAYL